MSQKKEQMLSYRLLFSGLGFGLAAVIALAGQPVPGLELLPLLPLTFGLACALVGDVFRLWKASIGYAVLLLVMLLRYLGSPVLIAATGHTLSAVSVSPEGFRAAVLIMCAELFAVMATLWWVQGRQTARDLAPAAAPEQPALKISWHSLLVPALLLGLLLVRGRLGSVISHKSFALWISRDRSPLDTYDLEILMVLKAFVLVLAAVWSAGVLKTSKKTWLKVTALLALALAVALNVLWYYHANRSVLVYAAACTIAVLVFCFPKFKKPALVLGMVAVLVLAGYSVFTHTLQMKGKQVSLMDTAQTTRLSEIGELYSNGVSTMGHTFDTVDAAKKQVSVKSFAHDIVRYLRFFSYPGLRAAYSAFQDTPTAASIFRDSLGDKPFILPNYGLAAYWLGKYPGLVLDLLFHVGFVLCIHLFTQLRKRSGHAGYLYVLTYCEAICGITLLNNVGLMLGQLSGLPLLIFLCFWLTGVLQKRLHLPRKKA